MKKKFKKGDRVRLINVGDLPNESENWIKASNEGFGTRRVDKLEIGSELTIVGVFEEPNNIWISLKETAFHQLEERFELV